ncbi:hypothetical protein CGI22_13325 [Vibrio parahaemolyticus]|uniref:hypothetical protein n=1 Tax=Vibrio parahaemolyticus TaxID=670 RepID=UPI0010AA7C70|nr:hypothetical protein [Vibrio parahaemolyticus]THE59844.1 hypothetical protein E4P16_14080 [Vibrio parahaemolyticus]TOK23585.1 hypothetical protein CGI22_13325 [Vibrio parahaemolyticus]
MNPFLTELLNTIGIDIQYLKTYLSAEELTYFNDKIRSSVDFQKDFYTESNGENLEVLLYFLCAHKKEVTSLMQDSSKIEVLINLYTSDVISGDYDCFRFDLSKFPQTYKPSNEVLTLYRIGRKGESVGNLGSSWSKNVCGLKAYYQASSMTKEEFNDRPVFVIEINDSEVLFEGSRKEQELVLKAGFEYRRLELVDDELRNKIYT